MSRVPDKPPSLIALDSGGRLDFLKKVGEIVYCIEPRRFLSRIRREKFDGVFVFQNTRIIKQVWSRIPAALIVLFTDGDVPASDVSLWTDKVIDISEEKAPDVVIREMFEARAVLEKAGMFGRSESFYGIGDAIKRVAPTQLPVLVLGESGVGKELVARAVHINSERADSTFVPVNISAIPETLIEAELFGHRKGAFTGAIAHRDGYFVIADGGTIFLDEIGELSLAAQVKLLRIIETKEFYPVGSSKAVKIDTRIVAATNRDIHREVRDGRFRDDLYYRLSAVQIQIPPLRERPMDILLLIERFKESVERRSRRHFPGFSEDAVSAMLHYRWTGNVRELSNLVASAAALSPNRKVTADDLTSYFERHRDLGRDLPVASSPSLGHAEILQLLGHFSTQIEKLSERIKSLEQKIEPYNPVPSKNELVLKALQESGGNKTRAAARLGISRRTLYRWLEKYRNSE